MKPDELYAARETLGLTQTEMGKLLGVKLRGYQYWEKGERAIPALAERVVNESIAKQSK